MKIEWENNGSDDIFTSEIEIEPIGTFKLLILKQEIADFDIHTGRIRVLNSNNYVKRHFEGIECRGLNVNALKSYLICMFNERLKEYINILHNIEEELE